MCESNLLRAEAAVERHQAKRLREPDDPADYMAPDPTSNELHARLSEAKADLFEAQADYVLHNYEPEEGK
jgi:hypothetical protein